MKLFLAGFFVLTFCSSGLAQGDNRVAAKIPNFAGKWVFDKVKSDAGTGGNVSFADGALVVTQDEYEIVMISTENMDGRKFVRKTIYVIKGSTKGTGKIDDGSKVAAAWEGNKLVIKTRGALAPVTTRDLLQQWRWSKSGLYQPTEKR